MSAPVDVLQAMENGSCILAAEAHGEHAEALTEACAAVAELIEAAKAGKRNHFGRLILERDEADRLTAALARVQP